VATISNDAPPAKQLENTMNRQLLKTLYMLVVIAAAASALLYSVVHLPIEKLDARFVALFLLTIAISSRLTVRIPRTTGHISVSDTFFFLTILLYGGEAAVLLAAAEALCSATRFSRKAILFNSAMIACSTFLTFVVTRALFGELSTLHHGPFSGKFMLALCVMAFVQYASNSTMAAIYTSLKMAEPLWHTWTKYYLWASITYFAGASAAGFTVKFAEAAGVYGLLATAPIVAVLYFTYRTYLRNIEVMSAAAKAEEVAAHAEEAERHVAELNHYIEEQKRIREQFSQIEKMSALGELASGVAHDFNNTLAGVLGRAQLLLETKDSAKVEAGLNIIIKTAKDGARTVKRIQDFARQRRDHDFQPVDVRLLLLDVGEITRPRWKNRAAAANIHINLEIECAPGVTAMGDESELREVLVNMVFNAVDALPNGGTLTMAAKQTRDAVEILVRDTGMGMSEETRLRVFDPFFTTKDKAGMGLGLAVSYGIIRRHDATVDVESQLGLGTTFRIRLPIPGRVAKTHAVTPFVNLPRRARTSSPTRILVVDDEEYVRDLLRDILEKEGCEAVVADGGYQALSLFENGNFDAVFTDIGMPGMNGWELSRAVRQRNTDIPVAVITGWGEAVGSQERQAAQVDWVLAKPFEAPQIAEMAHEVSRRRVVSSQRTPKEIAA
jgi:signal transduction histidine kinase/ActR/RegA family two-component response regulator